MSNFKRKMRKAAQTLHESGVLLATQSMVYECESCGKRWRMYLQEGLEDHGEYHKPVPFYIRCSCGGTAHHADWFLDENYEPPIEIDDRMSYFANKKESDCGVPVLRKDAGMEELQKEADKEIESILLSQYSTAQLKEELRRRERKGGTNGNVTN